MLISFLKCSKELCDFCGFIKVLDTSQFTRFKDKYCPNIAEMFEHMVDITEPICRKISAEKADYLIYDTTGIEPPVSENNSKFLNTKLKESKKFVKQNPDYNPYIGVSKLLPEMSQTNLDARQQYINGHFCYAAKVWILTDGLGIPRHVSFFDDAFRQKHDLEAVPSDHPDCDKKIGYSSSLKPVLTDFFSRHPSMKHDTFIEDAAFDSYGN